MLDDLIKKEKKRFDKVKAPDNMEEELFRALEDIETENLNNMDTKRWSGIKKFCKKHMGKVAIIFIISSIVITSNSYTIAEFFSKDIKENIIGYEELTTGNMMEYIENGLGQELNEKYVFKDGSEIILQGILVDNMSIRVFVDSPRDKSFTASLKDSKNIKTFQVGSGLEDEKSNRTKWIYTLDYKTENKDIDILFNLNDINQELSRTINLDKAKIIDEYDEISINKTIKVNDYKVRFKEIKITPISINIEGYTENILELGIRSLFGDKMKSNNIDISLIINGVEVVYNYAGRSTDISGSTFKFKFTEIPKGNIESLSILLKEVGNNEVNEIVKIK